MQIKKTKKYKDYYRLILRILVLIIIFFSVVGQVSLNRPVEPWSQEQPVFQFSLPQLGFFSFSIGGKIQNLVYGALIFWLLGCFWDKKLRPRYTDLTLKVLCFIIVFGISWAFSPVRYLSWKTGMRDLLIEGGFFFILMSVFRLPKYRKTAFVVLMSGVSLTVFAGLLLYLRGDYFPQTPQRLWLSFYHPNSSGSALVLLIPIMLSFLLSRTSIQLRLLCALVLVILGVAMYLTYSRTAWFSLLVAILVLSLRWKRSYYLISALVLVFLLLVLGINLGPQTFLKDRVKMEFWKDPNVNKRLIYWEAAVHMFVARPLFGSGPGYGVFMHSYESCFKKIETGELPPGPHNQYLCVAASTGCLGLLAFIWLFITLIKNLSRVERRAINPFDRNFSAGLKAGLIGFLVGFLADDPLLNIRVSFLFWLLLGFLAAQMAHRRVLPDNSHL